MNKVMTQFRVNEDLYQKVKSIARIEMRSINAQMEYFIAESIKQYEQKGVKTFQMRNADGDQSVVP